ncbi:MAG: DUF1415 domain-containing protein [Burkholderiales bacterium]|nr:DUF1415 domain-containing protein [Burkholderiales bacterium]
MESSPYSLSDDAATALTERWLERAVIGLNLCPFAKSVHVKQQIHYRVSRATEPRDVLLQIEEELKALHAADPSVRDTTLLMAPDCFADFLDFNDFLHDADRVLTSLNLEGEIQIASFHPQFQFAGTTADDITNYTNRAPFPTFHLIREDSIARAVEAFPQAEMIFEKNMETLERLGHAGWKALELDVDPMPGDGKP